MNHFLSTKSTPMTIRWYHCLTLIAIFGWMSPLPVTIAIGQDGSTTISVERPTRGNAPTPPAATPSTPVPPSSSQSSDFIENDDTNKDTVANAEVSNEAQMQSIGSERSPTASAQSTSSANTVRNLSVEPGTRPLLPVDRPAWVGAAPDLSGATHRLFVGSMPTSDAANADRALDEPLIAAVNEYIDTHILEERNASHSLEIDENYIRRNLLSNSDGYTLELSTSEGPMYQKWVTLEITPEQRAQIQTWHREAMQRKRVAPLGLAMVTLLGVVGASHLVMRRKFGSSQIGPLRSGQDALAETTYPQSKSGSLFRFVIFAMALFMLSAFAMGLAGYTLLAPSTVHRTASPAQVQIPTAELPELPAIPSSLKTEPLRESSAEVKLETNGQKIIIIRKSSQ